MASTKTCLTALLLGAALWLPLPTLAATPDTPATTPEVAEAQARAEASVEQLQAPLYNAFTERYLLDEVKNLRQMVADLRVEATEKIVDREIMVASTAVRYATDTVTYFFYLIAGASTILVLVGWNSLRDIKERAGAFANDEIRRITASYEQRLDKLEEELSHKSRHIAQAQEEIELTNEIHSLWLKASQENTAEAKIAIYDQILELRADDVEALTYKADAALLLGQAQWARSLANRALDIDPENSHALYQRACAYAESDLPEEALRDLHRAIRKTDSLRVQAGRDSSFVSLHEHPHFLEMVVLPNREDDDQDSPDSLEKPADPASPA